MRNNTYTTSPDTMDRARYDRDNGSKTAFWVVLALILAALIAAFFLFDFRVTDRGEMPAVSADVNVEGGRLPSAEVRGPDVSVTTTEKAVEVPKIEMTTEQVNVPVPDVSVQIPEDTK